MDLSTISYLDDDLVDMLWMQERGEGITTEQQRTIKANVEAKATFTSPSSLIGSSRTWVLKRRQEAVPTNQPKPFILPRTG
jgi:hypothetical protein